jgi:carbon-monoxide dehydrogenase catalytic subunit
LSQINLGVIKEEDVNIIIHGHEPALAEILALVTQDLTWSLMPSQGRKGISLAGMCCTANEILMRHGVPIGGNFTAGASHRHRRRRSLGGRFQCIMQGLSDVAQCYHTKLITDR